MALDIASSVILENTTAFWSGVLKDQTGAVIPSSALSALKLTHMVHDTSVLPYAVINTRNQQNVLNTNNVTVDGAGLVTWEMLPVDNIIVDTTLTHAQQEGHVSILEFEWNAGARKGKHVINTVITQLERMP